jgi:hypothetical protein
MEHIGRVGEVQIIKKYLPTQLLRKLDISAFLTGSERHLANMSDPQPGHVRASPISSG